MRVGILGSGLMGGKLGTIFARAGHEVVFSYARREEKLKKLAGDAGRNARAGTPGEAAQDTDASAMPASILWTLALYGLLDTPFALLIGQLAYEGSGGPELAYRFERFGR